MKKLCMLAISLNEEKYVKYWIDNHRKYVDEIVLVDTGSTDRTVEIAKELCIKVFNFSWEHHFARAKNFALRCCSIACNPDWIFFLSPDNWVSNADMEIIRGAIEEDDYDAYRMQTVYHKGDYLNMEKLTPISPGTGHIVLFKNDPYIYYSGRIHETIDSSCVLTNKKVGFLDIWKHHGTGDLTTEKGRIDNKKKTEYYAMLDKMGILDDAFGFALNQMRELLWMG